MRRLVALVVLLAFAAATAAPAIAACRMRTAQQDCCCAPAPANAFCAPDCCAPARPASHIGDVTTQLRGFALVAPLPIVLSAALVDGAAARVLPAAGARVGLHERAAPRLPLRI